MAYLLGTLAGGEDIMTGHSDNVHYGALIEEGIKAAEEGNTLLALRLFNQVGSEKMSPLVLSYHGYCIAHEQRAFEKALELSNKALQADRTHPLIYLNLGRIYMAAGYEKKAEQVFRRGIRCQRHPLLLRKLESISNRRRMLFPFLQRSNPLNVISGKLFSKFS
ncbi:MAG: tetratricopeptide repeat protein [Desulfuromusa sp.]|nr:tetratricopeptide repeat protein [Desulfuromusa sp.]